MELNPLYIQNLPLEIQLEILSKLNRRDLLHLCQVNTSWRNICKDELLWKILVFQDFGDINKLGNSWYDTYKNQYNKFTIFVNTLLTKYSFIGSKNLLIKLLISYIKNNREYSSRIINIDEWDNPIDDLYELIISNVKNPVGFRITNLISDINNFLINLYHPNISSKLVDTCRRCRSNNCLLNMFFDKDKNRWRFRINCSLCSESSYRYELS
jgi:hypothetical protein